MTVLHFNRRVEQVLDSVAGQEQGAATAGLSEQGAATAAPDAGKKLNGHPEPGPLAAAAAPGVKAAAPQGGSYVAGKVFSPSQINTYLACPAKWMFRYLWGREDPTNGDRHLGTAAHWAMEQNSLYKMATGRDMEPAEALAAYETAWGRQERVVWAPEEDPAALKAKGAELVQVYLQQVAPIVQPAAVEVPVEGEIAGVAVRGKVDLLEEDGTIVDVKTSARKQEPGDGYKLQVTLYQMLLDQVSPLAAHRLEARLVQITKTKEPQVVSWPVRVNEAQRRYAGQIVPLVDESIRTEVFYPRRDSTLCSRKYCPYWRDCEREFGGEVS